MFQLSHTFLKNKCNLGSPTSTINFKKILLPKSKSSKEEAKFRVQETMSYKLISHEEDHKEGVITCPKVEPFKLTVALNIWISFFREDRTREREKYCYPKKELLETGQSSK